MIFQNKNIHYNILNIGISLIPIAFILGNTAINLNILLILLYSFFLFGLQIFETNLKYFDKVIILFFTYILINGILNNFFNFDFPDSPDQNIIIKKTLLYLRFLILYFIIRFLINKNIIDYRIIFISFGLCSLFVSVDIIIQYIFGTDIFGNKSFDRRLSGPFGDEKIAGSFIQRFFIFLPYSILLFLKIDNKFFQNILLILILIIILFGTFLSGNRVPLAMLVLSLVFLSLFEIKIRKNLILILIIFLAGFYFLTLEKGEIKNKYRHHFKNLVLQSTKIAIYAKNKVKTGKIIAPDICKNIDAVLANELSPEYSKIRSECSKYLNVYIKEIESGILTWEKNKVFGGGIKSFRWNCSEIDRSKMEFFVTKKGKVNCNNHPHNYYLHIVSELGFFGFLLIIILFISIIIRSFLYLTSSKYDYLEKRIFFSFFVIFILEIFPFKTSGSFFTTSNATFLFIIISFTIGLLECKKLKKNG